MRDGTMTRRFLVASLALALAWPAAGLDATASLGVGAWRTDSWGGGALSTQKAWDFSASLSLSGVPFRPGLLSWSASGDYRRLRSLYFDTETTASDVTFSAGASLFTDSAASLQLDATRTWSDYTGNGLAPTAGSTVITNLAARGTFRLAARPTVTAAVSNLTLENHSFGQPVNTAETTQLTLTAAQDFAAFNYGLQYDTSWNDGSLAPSNYRSHSVTLQGGAELASGVDAQVQQRYFLRDPTVSAATNPRLDDSALTTSLFIRRSSDLLSRVDYQYLHLLSSVPGSAARDAVTHVARAGTEYRGTPDWTFSGSVGASRSDSRFGATAVGATTEELGAGVHWQRLAGAYGWTAGGGASVGLQQRDGEDSRGAAGASASVGVNVAPGSWVGNLTYSASFSQNLGGLIGSDFSHLLSGSAETYAGEWQLRALLMASSARRDAAAFGTSISRSITTTLYAIRARLQLQLQLGLTDAVSGQISSPVDGLFLPADFNTSSRYVTLTATTALGRSLNATASARYLQSTAPGRSLVWEEGANLTLFYALGAFTLSLEERYSVGGYGDTSQHGNLLMARLTRSFGAHY